MKHLMVSTGARESQDRRFSLKYLNENKGHEDPSFPDPKHAYPLSFNATTKALVTAVLQCVKIHDTVKACTAKQRVIVAAIASGCKMKNRWNGTHRGKGVDQVHGSTKQKHPRFVVGNT